MSVSRFVFAFPALLVLAFPSVAVVAAADDDPAPKLTAQDEQFLEGLFKEYSRIWSADRAARYRTGKASCKMKNRADVHSPKSVL
jgi:hypothetical protein